MKNKLFFHLLVSGLVIVLLVSCKKENFQAAKPETASPSLFVTSRPVGLNQSGIITGKINPVGAYAYIVLMDQQGQKYGTYYPDPITGIFRTGQLPAGAYKLFLTYSLNAVTFKELTTIILAVDVHDGAVTDIGTIDL